MILTLSFVYTFASWLKRSQRERNLLWAFWNTYLWVDNFFGPTLRMLAKEATYFDVLHAIYTETSGRTLEKKCYHMRNLTYSLQWNAMKKVRKLVRLEYMQISPAGRQTSTSRSGCMCGCICVCVRACVISLAWVSSVTQELLAFTTPCSAAILPDRKSVV